MPSDSRHTKQCPFERAFTFFFRALNRVKPWHKYQGTWFQVFNLLAIRLDLRRFNLHDTSTIAESNQSGGPKAPPGDGYVYSERQIDGSFNDLYCPVMGMVNARFGRNIPLERAYPNTSELMEPNPFRVSREILARTDFKPATSLNLLAASWIQFQTHDWFFHGTDNTSAPIEIPVDKSIWGNDKMEVFRTPQDPSRQPNDLAGPPTFANKNTHWWDASQIYGSDIVTAKLLREDASGNALKNGQLRLEKGMLGHEPVNHLELTGFSDNWWLGLSMLHTLFTREHNQICNALKSEYSHFSDDKIYHTAHLINSALMAKIHTVEWTTAILAHPALQIGMRANWWGLFDGKLAKWFPWLEEIDEIGGIVGSIPDHHGAPYCLTEEFVAVYRMHPLIPDSIEIHSTDTGALIEKYDMLSLLGPEARDRVLSKATFEDCFYSFGIQNPGALTLANYPNFLQSLELPLAGSGPKQKIDLGAVDILRDRERGVPRYNEFRRHLRLPPLKSFDDLSIDRELKEKLKTIYGDPNRLDLMVGMFAEKPPEKFGFSDTAFRIFILMASRRLKSDRFLTSDYREEIYTPLGVKWVEDNSMVSVIERNYPQLGERLRGVQNAFVPWM